MARNLAPLICILVMAMDVVAGILGIEAEIAQNKVKHLRMWIFECRDPSYEAYKLGIAAVLLLTLAHVIANLFGGCICIWSRADFEKANSNKQLAVSCLILSWIVLATGFSLLMIGTLANSRSRKSCGIAHHRFLSIGGIVCFIHGIFIIAYCLSAKVADTEENKNRQGHHQPGGPA
ncbi:protein DESIGUAL 2 [Humulus lupulus]|uniref:protein DESIGUAL 2 n=1 Tax=Humulus lupulus TaxID=3486 RepID=UPI002B40527C|nr:protein DESIGUAL 2 [Humulus lupulus]